MSHARRLAGGLGLAVLSLAVTLGMIEVVLRVMPAWSQATTRGERFAFNPYRPDGRLGYALRPAVRMRHADRDFSVAVSVNGLAMRDPERPAAKRPGVGRILLLGDSFAFGWGVEREETFAAELERQLVARGARVEVLSAAVPGWSTDQHYVYLRMLGLALEPDLVLLASSENDVTEIGLNRLTLGKDRLPVRIEPMWRMIDATGRMRYLGSEHPTVPRAPWSGEAWLRDHTVLYHWLRFRFAKAAAALAVRRALPPAPEWLATDPERPIADIPPDEVQRALGSSPAFRVRYHLYLLEAMERETRARGIALRILLVAHSGQTQPADPGLAPLHAACAAGGACFDSALVVSAPDMARFTFAHDSHWNRDGHRVVGEALASWLARDPALRIPGLAGSS